MGKLRRSVGIILRFKRMVFISWRCCFCSLLWDRALLSSRFGRKWSKGKWQRYPCERKRMDVWKKETVCLLLVKVWGSNWEGGRARARAVSSGGQSGRVHDRAHICLGLEYSRRWWWEQGNGGNWSGGVWVNSVPRRGSRCGRKGRGRRELTRTKAVEVTGQTSARVWFVGRKWWLKTKERQWFFFFGKLYFKFCWRRTIIAIFGF